MPKGFIGDDIHFGKYGGEPVDWRKMPPDPDDLIENDEDLPCPEHVKAILGFDPDEFDDE